VENLFDRAKAVNLDSWAEGRPVLEKFAAQNALLGEIDYTPSRKAAHGPTPHRVGSGEIRHRPVRHPWT
jgi:hypothetical protein